jgi:hypothetical protein
MPGAPAARFNCGLVSDWPVCVSGVSARSVALPSRGCHLILSSQLQNAWPLPFQAACARFEIGEQAVVGDFMVCYSVGIVLSDALEYSLVRDGEEYGSNPSSRTCPR